MLEPNLVEGWRAVYNTVLRFGMSERFRVKEKAHGPESGGVVSESGLEPMREQAETNAEDDAMHGVIELVEDVKRHGVSGTIFSLVCLPAHIC